MPRRLFPRLLVLLLAVLIANAMIALWLLRAATFDTTASYSARSLETQIVAADALLASTDRAAAEARLVSLGLRHQHEAPAPGRAALGMWRLVESTLSARLPARELRIAPQPQPTLWIAAARAGDGWIGIPLLGLRDSLRGTTAISLLLTLLIVTGAAALIARTLVEPLHLLAKAAPRIAAGEPAPALPAHAAVEIRDLAGALDRAATDARNAAREREIMLAGLSHDMRTPLARLGVALEMIDGEADLKHGMSADIAELDAMTGQFIAFVRDGRDEAVADTDVGALLDEALAAQQRAGREWVRRGARDLRLRAKPLALRRALDNLLENAVRHGRAPFEAELDGDARSVRITIRDHGPGVPTARLADLGRPFFRADPARSGAGSGLGLAIAARLAAAHGGSLDLRNRGGGGFEAVLRLAAIRS